MSLRQAETAQGFAETGGSLELPVSYFGSNKR